MRPFWTLAAVLLLAGVPVVSAAPSPCAIECRDEGVAFGWSRAGKKACKASCQQEQRKCKKLPQGDQPGCVARNRDCAEYCGHTWPARGQTGDRSACHVVCGSCYRSSTQFCVEARPDPMDFVARCCGGEGQPSCCPLTTLAGLNQCADLQSDALNCGIRRRECDLSQSQLCIDATCMAPPTCPGGCAAGLSCCATDTVGGGHCVNLTSHRDNCGQCGKLSPERPGVREQRMRRVVHGVPEQRAVPDGQRWDSVLPEAGKSLLPEQSADLPGRHRGRRGGEVLLSELQPHRGIWLCRATEICCYGAGGAGYREGCCPPDTQCVPNPLVPGLNYCASQ